MVHNDSWKFPLTCKLAAPARPCCGSNHHPVVFVVKSDSDFRFGGHNCRNKNCNDQNWDAVQLSSGVQPSTPTCTQHEQDLELGNAMSATIGFTIARDLIPLLAPFPATGRTRNQRTTIATAGWCSAVRISIGWRRTYL